MDCDRSGISCAVGYTWINKKCIVGVGHSPWLNGITPYSDVAEKWQWLCLWLDTRTHTHICVSAHLYASTGEKKKSPHLRPRSVQCLIDASQPVTVSEQSASSELSTCAPVICWTSGSSAAESRSMTSTPYKEDERGPEGVGEGGGIRQPLSLRGWPRHVVLPWPKKKRPLTLCIKSEHCSYHGISAWSGD